MTKKSRYFLAGSAAVLLVGLGAGTLAYLTYYRNAGVPAGLPAELKYVPADAQMVAYADVRSVMASEMRRELERMTTGRRGQQQMHEFAGIDFEKDVNRVVAFITPEPASQATDATPGPPAPPRILLLAQGTFDQARVEQFMKDHGGVIEDYHGKHLVIRQDAAPFPRPPAPPTAPRPPSADQTTPPTRPGVPDIQPRIEPQAPQTQTQPMRRPPPETAIGFVRSDLMAVGGTDLVRQALDGSATTANITANSELMALIHDDASANAWVVGQFDAVSRRIGLPPSVRGQVPPLRLVAASAHIDGAVRATVKALTNDEAAANQLRDVVRGAISFARLQNGLNADLQNALKTVELGGTGTTVQLSFTVTPDIFKGLPPGPRPPSPPLAPEPPSTPK